MLVKEARLTYVVYNASNTQCTLARERRWRRNRYGQGQHIDAWNCALCCVTQGSMPPKMHQTYDWRFNMCQQV